MDNTPLSRPDSRDPNADSLRAPEDRLPESKKELAAYIIRLLDSAPEEWIFGEFTATFGGLEIWTANRPYADLTTAGMRIGTFWQRWKIRRLLDRARERYLIKNLLAAESAKRAHAVNSNALTAEVEERSGSQKETEG